MPLGFLVILTAGLGLMLLLTCIHYLINMKNVTKNELRFDGVILVVFLLLSSWVYVGSSHLSYSQDEYEIRIANDIAYVIDGDKLVNINKETGRNFKDGDKVYKYTTRCNMRYGINSEDLVEWLLEPKMVPETKS